jgi:hypothetical protein
MKDYKLKQRNLLASHTQTLSLVLMVYLQQIQKKAKAEEWKRTWEIKKFLSQPLMMNQDRNKFVRCTYMKIGKLEKIET